MKPKVQYRVRKNPSLVPVLSHISRRSHACYMTVHLLILNLIILKA
jgi:hypothetical protein